MAITTPAAAVVATFKAVKIKEWDESAVGSPSLRMKVLTYTHSNEYPTGGDACDLLAATGFGGIFQVTLPRTVVIGGHFYVPSWDATNKKMILLGGSNTTSYFFTEIASATNCAAVSYTIIVWGT